MGTLNIRELLRFTLIQMQDKWKSRKIVLNPKVSIIAVEEANGSDMRYSCMRYREAHIFTFGKKSFVIAWGEADFYYLTEHIDSDMIVLPFLTNCKKFSGDQLAKKIRKIIENSKEFSMSVWIGLRDGRLLAGPLLKKLGGEVLIELSFMDYLRSIEVSPIRYSEKTISHLLQNLEKVIMSL